MTHSRKVAGERVEPRLVDTRRVNAWYEKDPPRRSVHRAVQPRGQRAAAPWDSQPRIVHRFEPRIGYGACDAVDAGRANDEPGRGQVIR